MQKLISFFYVDDFYLVPTVKELNKYLYDYHIKNFHCNYKDTMHFFKSNKIRYYGIEQIIIDYIANCPVCVQSSRIIHREEPVKSLSVDGPNIHYEFDLTYLNSDLASAFGVKYLLGIIDVLSEML
jgi:hypothetical protein